MSRSGSSRAWAIGLAWAVLLCGIGVSLALALRESNTIATDARQRFAVIAQRALQLLRERVSRPVYGLKGARGVYAASKSVEPAEFRAYVASRDLEKEFPGVWIMGALSIRGDDELASFQEKMRADGAEGFTARPDESSDRHLLVQHAEPSAKCEGFAGADLVGVPGLLREVDSAVLSGEAVLTPSLPIVIGSASRRFCLWLVPVYRNGLPRATPEERRAACEVVLFALLETAELGAAMIADLSGMADVEAYQGDTPSDTTMLMDADGHLLGHHGEVKQEQYAGRSQVRLEKLTIGGQDWTVAITSTPKFDETIHEERSILAGCTGVLASALLSSLVWLISTARLRAEAMAGDMTRDLRRLSLIAQRTANPVVVTDAQRRIEWVNDAFVRLTGYSLDEARGKKPGSFMQCERSDPEAIQRMRAALDKGESCRAEIVNRARSGSEFILDIDIQPLHDEAGTLTGFMAVETDVTALREAEERAQSASRAKGEFLAQMSHEIRTPINGVSGMLDLMLDSDLDARQRGYLNLARVSVANLTQVINDILDLSKLEAGKMTIEQTAFDVRQLVEGASILMAARAEQKGIELSVAVETDVPYSVQGDPARIRQVLLNLIGNAVKFTSEGAVSVRVGVDSLESEAARVRFTVSDTGAGLTQEQQGRLFQAFSQADASTTRKHGGTGLGLAISRRFVELMRGTIGVESEPGRGSTFWFTLPLRPVVDDHCPFDSSPLANKRVLIVGGSDTGRAVLRAYSECWRMIVEEAKSLEDLAGGHALTDSHSGVVQPGDPFDIVVLDIGMSGEGLDTPIARIRADPRMRDAAVILMHPFGSTVRSGGEWASHISGELITPVSQSDLHNAYLRAVVGSLDNAAAHVSRLRATEESVAPPPGSAQRRCDVRVLVAEDNEINQIIDRELLTRAGFECVIVENGRLAVEALMRERFDLVLMDCQMPEMDGFEASREIRTLERSGDLATGTPNPLVILALTANAMEGDREKCIAAGMSDYLTKPIEVEKLLARINNVLAARHRAAA